MEGESSASGGLRKRATPSPASLQDSTGGGTRRSGGSQEVGKLVGQARLRYDEPGQRYKHARRPDVRRKPQGREDGVVMRESEEREDGVVEPEGRVDAFAHQQGRQAHSRSLLSGLLMLGLGERRQMAGRREERAGGGRRAVSDGVTDGCRVNSSMLNAAGGEASSAGDEGACIAHRRYASLLSVKADAPDAVGAVSSALYYRDEDTLGDESDAECSRRGCFCRCAARSVCRVTCGLCQSPARCWCGSIRVAWTRVAVPLLLLFLRTHATLLGHLCVGVGEPIRPWSVTCEGLGVYVSIHVFALHAL